MKLKHKILLWLAPSVASFTLRCICRTVGLQEHISEDLHPRRTKTKKGVIYATWHSRLLLGMYIYRNLGINVLVSRSRDGEYVARALNRFGFTTTRGSTSRGGMASLKELAELLKNGTDVIITPDGPRGPREQAKQGIIQLAALTGARIVPWTWASNQMKLLNSWDRLRIPIPFSQCQVWFGNSIQVARKSCQETFSRKKEELEEELHRLSGLEQAIFPNISSD